MVCYIEAYLVKVMASTDSAVQEPLTYNESKQGQESIQWMQAVKEEMDALFKAGSCGPTTRTQGPWREIGLQAHSTGLVHMCQRSPSQKFGRETLYGCSSDTKPSG